VSFLFLYLLSANKENIKIFRKYVDIKVPLSILPQYMRIEGIRWKIKSILHKAPSLCGGNFLQKP
jgi:hypothetical protein